MNEISTPISPIFIVGLPRTGSTLWSNIVARDDSVMRFGEMHFLNPWHPDFKTFLRREIGCLEKDRNVGVLVNKLFLDKAWIGLRGNYWEQIRKISPDILKQRLHTAILASDRGLGSVFRILVEETTRIRGYQRCLIKFPVYINHIEDLAIWFPSAKIVHITRDPRATAVSKLSDPGGTGKRHIKAHLSQYALFHALKMFVALQYEWSSRAHRAMVDNPNYCLLRYEDLLVNPEPVIRELCAHTGMTYTPDMLSPNKGQPSSITGQRREGFDPVSALRWQERLSPWEANLIGWLTRPAMHRLGYDPEVHPIFKLATLAERPSIGA